MQKKAASHATDSVSSKPKSQTQAFSSLSTASLARNASASHSSHAHAAAAAAPGAPIAAVPFFGNMAPRDDDLFRGAAVRSGGAVATRALHPSPFPGFAGIGIPPVAASQSLPLLHSQWRGVAKAHPALGGDAFNASPASANDPLMASNSALLGDPSAPRAAVASAENALCESSRVPVPGGELRSSSVSGMQLPSRTRSLGVLRDTLPHWEGALCPYTTYRSAMRGRDLFARVERELSLLRDSGGDQCLDFASDAREGRACGRVHGAWDQSDFTIQVWRAPGARRDCDRDCVLEVRRYGGCCFVHDGFVRRLVARLNRGGAALRAAASQAVGAKQLADATPAGAEVLVPCAPQGPMQWDDDFDDDFDDEDETEPDVRFRDFRGTFEATEDGAASDSLITPREKEDVEMKAVGPSDRIRGLVEAATNRECYREEYRNSVAQLADMVKDEKYAQMVNCEDSDVMAKLLQPLTCDLFDTFIILKVILIVKHLAACPGITMGDNVIDYLKTIKETWSGSPSHNLGTVTVTFPPSHQVVSAVKECLEEHNTLNL